MAINPFSFAPFMQVPQVNSGPGWGVLPGILAEQRRFKQAQLENEQSNTRANAALKLQQDYQSRKFEQEDKSELEGLIAEFQAAEDQGDMVTYDRVRQKLQRMGLDVSSAGAARASLAQQPEAQSPELSQQDFEAQLTKGYEADETPEDFEQSLVSGRSEPQAPEGDDPSYGKVVDLLKGKRPRLSTQPLPQVSVAQPAPGEQATPQANVRPLATQRLGGDVIRKGGKAIYASNAEGFGRSSPIVAAAFEPFLKSEDPEVAALAKQSSDYAAKLVQADGVPQAKAIQEGVRFFESRLQDLNQLRRTKIGSRRPIGGGGGGAPAWVPGKSKNLSPENFMRMANQRLGAVNKSDQVLSQAEAAINSSNPAVQRDAIRQLVQARSGAAVSDKERANYDALEGQVVRLKEWASRLTGDAVDPDFVRSLHEIIATQRGINERSKRDIAREHAEMYKQVARAMNPGAPPELIEQLGSQAEKTTLSGGNFTSGEEEGGDPLSEF